MTPTRPTEGAWEPEPLQLPLEPRRPVTPRVPYWQSEDDSEAQRSEPERPPGSHVIVIDIA